MTKADNTVAHNIIADFFTSKLAFLIFFLQLTPIWVFAQQFTGPVAAGVGGAGVASAEVVETVFLNPATLAHAPTFSGGVYYEDGYLQGSDHRTQLAANLVDNSQGVFLPGALGYIQRRQSFFGQKAWDEKVWNVSLGDFVFKHLSLGVTFYYLQQEFSGQKYDQLNGHVGLMWNPHPDFALASVFYNLKEVDENMPEHLQQQPKARLGFNYIINQFVRVRMDVAQQLRLNPEDKREIMGGLETFLNQFLILRAGWKSLALQRQDTLTAGFSFLGPRFVVDYSFQQVQNQSSEGALHSVDMRVPF